MLGARGEIIVSATHSLVVERSIITNKYFIYYALIIASLQIVLLIDEINKKSLHFTQFWLDIRILISTRDNRNFIPSVTFISWAMIIPLWITGSLYPTCVSDRPISLSVKHIWLLRFIEFLVIHWFLTNINIPLKASDTFLEATAPAKLTIWNCPLLS